MQAIGQMDARFLGVTDARRACPSVERMPVKDADSKCTACEPEPEAILVRARVSVRVRVRVRVGVRGRGRSGVGVVAKRSWFLPRFASVRPAYSQEYSWPSSALIEHEPWCAPLMTSLWLEEPQPIVLPRNAAVTLSPASFPLVWASKFGEESL